MPTLGDRLRQLEMAQADEEARRQASQQRASEGAEQERREVVHKFFADAKRLTTQYIEAGKIPPPFVTPRGIQGNGSYTILDAKHPDHGIYAEFLAWAENEGLIVEGQRHEIGGRSAAKLYIRATK